MTALFTYLGWTWVLAALGSTAVALVLAASRTWRPALRPSVQHRIAAAALASCLVVVAIAPLALTAADDRSAPVSPAPAQSRPVAVGAEMPIRATAQPSGEGTRRANAVAAAVGAIWLAGVALMVVRLFGGWVVVRRLVGSARPVESPAMEGDLARLHEMMGVRVPVRLLESSQVDVPIVVGWRPVLILPTDREAQSSRETFEPLLAHELAHVMRRDYLMNMLQSVADAVLFAFPAARWISARVRETREYSCDEMALQVCGDRLRYVEALAGIATLSVARQPVAALGVGGPRLAARIRRLLHGDREMRHRRPRLIVLLASVALLVAATDRAAGLAAAQVGRLQSHAEAQPVPNSGQPFEVYMTYVFDQPGSAVVLTRAVAGASFACDSARVRNDANVAVTGLAFVAVVTLGARPGPVQIYSTDLVPVNVAPGREADVDVRLLPQADWGPLGAISPKIQVMCALAKVTYANGAVWEVTPNPAARTADAALSLPPAEVSRSQFSAAATPGMVCPGDRGASYSIGAIVPVGKEPGTFAECVDASSPEKGERAVRWIESKQLRLK